MAETRAQAAAKRGRNLEEDRDAPTRKRRPGDISTKETTAQHKCREGAIEDTRSPSPQPSADQHKVSTPNIFEAPANTTADNIDNVNPIDFWLRENRWPRQYFELDMEHLLARQPSSSSLSGRKRSISAASSTTPSDQKPREEKSNQYRDARYQTLLATKGSFMFDSPQGVTNATKKTLRSLLQKPQPVPKDSLFRDNIFKAASQKLQNKNEARVIQDISRLIVPSAETLATYGAKHLEILIESVNEGWNNSIPLTGKRPQPDYSVGFSREAFTKEQLEKIAPLIGQFLNGDQSFCMATYYMYFPFLTSEVKCGAAALDIADRQNAHSMTVAARGITELFRFLKRENEVHRQLLSFSISHDHQSARIYGCYPVIDGKDTKYYRHPIRNFDLTDMDGKEKWTAYQFTKNIYDIWMPEHFKKICSAIDQLPSGVNFDVPQLSESTGLSQELGSQLALSEAASESLPVEKDDQSGNFGPIATPDSSFLKPGPAKRRKSPAKKP